MKPVEQRIAIALACGWQWEGSFHPRRDKNFLCPPKGPVCTVWRDGLLGGNKPPDYPNDLNAIRSAIITLPRDRSAKSFLRFKVKLNMICDEPLLATAAELSEAFLKTLGLWREQPTQPQDAPV